MEPGQPWEKQAIMCPHVLFDEEDIYYKMWYATVNSTENMSNIAIGITI